MSNESDGSVHHLPNSSDGTERTGVVAKNAAPGIDLPALLARIENAWRTLESRSARVRELEELVDTLHEEQAETTARLEEADRRSTELEQSLAIERMHSSRAQKLAEEVADRANQLEHAAFEAVEKLEALTGAIDSAFAELPDEFGAMSEAA